MPDIGLPIMHTWVAFKQLTYVQPVLMLVSKIPTLNFETGPQCFWQNCTFWTSPFNNDTFLQAVPGLVSQSILFLHTNTNSCIFLDNIKTEKRMFGQHNYCWWHTVIIKVHNIAPDSITHYTTKCKKLLMSQFSL